MVFRVPRSSPRRLLDWFLMEKRGNLYLLPSYVQRLLALPCQSRTATQKPTLIYAIIAPGRISHEKQRRMQDNHISTGIYRCLILDFDKNFARIPERQESARINAFFMLCTHKPAPLDPRPGLLRGSLRCKDNHKSHECQLFNTCGEFIWDQMPSRMMR